MNEKEWLFSEKKVDLKDLIPIRTSHLFCHVDFSPISLTTCLMEGRNIACFQEARDSVLLSFLSEIKSFHAVRNLFFNFHAHLNLRIHSFAFSGTTLHRTHLAGPNAQWENHCLPPPVGCQSLFWTFTSLRIGPYFCTCTDLSTFCPTGSAELTHTVQKQVNFGKHCNSCSKKQASKQICTSLNVNMSRI